MALAGPILFSCRAAKNCSYMIMMRQLSPMKRLRHTDNNFSMRKMYWQYPCPEEVAALNYCNRRPQQTVERLLASVIAMDANCLRTEVQTRMSGRLWRVTLHFQWPCQFRVTGQSENRPRALHYAYLSACQMFTTLGLLSSDGEIIDVNEKMLEIEHHWNEWTDEHRFSLKTTHSGSGCQSHWAAQLQANWPIEIDLHATGLTRKDARRNIAALLVVKLKARRLLNRHLQLCDSLLRKLPRWHETTARRRDYELYVDASVVGYGAYLLCPPTSFALLNGQVRWIQERWSANLRQDFVASSNSSFFELYGLLSAIYTWKKRFADTTVLCCCDNLYVVHLVNYGLSARTGAMIHKLFLVLQRTCIKHRITLTARHIYRQDNVAADHLSKMKTEQFHEMLPNACIRSKKSKKLFFLPFATKATTRPEPIQNSSATLVNYSWNVRNWLHKS